MIAQTKNNLGQWEMYPFIESLDELGIPKPGKVLARDYKAKGSVPVIDQGQQFIAGWTDEDRLAIRDQLPFIVFGDHTRTFKFVDFPFALGADGTHLLKPKKDFNPRFFYYACLQLPLPNRGYNRHFTVLKEQSIPKPPKPEQEKIAAVLWKIQRAIQLEEKLLASTRQLKQSALLHVLTRGLRNEPLIDSDIGPIPESWTVQPISSKAKLTSGGTPSRANKRYWDGGTIPWVKTGEVDYCVITNTEERITSAGLENSAAKIFPKGTLLIAMYGQGVTRGKVAMLGIDATTNQACAGITPTSGELLPFFLYYYLTFSYERLRALSHGAHQQNLNAELVGSFPFALPRKDEQGDIIRILQTIDRKISVHERKRDTLQEIFRTMLQQLMKGQVRVENLQIDLTEIQ